VVRAWVVKDKRRLFELRAEVRAEEGGVLLADADATMYRIRSTGDSPALEVDKNAEG
jgi:hypothetical protein